MPRPVLIGLGGATSSGKSTLAARLAPLLRAPIVPQDDFALPETQLRWDERIQGHDWDDPEQSIDYPRFAAALRELHSGSPPPPSSKPGAPHPVVPSEPMATPPPNLPIIRQLQQRLGGAPIILVDGFLLYWDAAVRRQLDVRIFLRAHEDEVRARREGRVYHTAEGTTWSDPKGYFDAILWPSYIKAHRGLFSSSDPESGSPLSPPPPTSAAPDTITSAGKHDSPDSGAPVAHLQVIETRGRNMDDVTRDVCVAIEHELRRCCEDAGK